MSGRYYGVDDDHSRDEHDPEHLPMPEIHNPADNQSYYDPPLSPDRSASAAPQRRASAYSQYSPPEEHPGSSGHEYPAQAYSMPHWPEDDIYRLGTPASGTNVPYNYYQAPPPPAPPRPYVEEDYPSGDPDDPAPSYTRRYSGFVDDDDRRPILQGQSSQATMRSEDPGSGNPPPSRRASTSKWADVETVRLAGGNLVLNCPLPTALMDKVPRKAPLEFSCMRYSAATCDPSEFIQNRFALRQQLFGVPRQTELFIVVTMYSESEDLFANTMIGVFKNIEYMCTKAKEKTWGEDGWKKIVVCVVSDGRQKIDAKTRSLLAAMGCYQEGIAKTKVNDKVVQAHIYEHTTQVGIRKDGNKVTPVPGGLTVPVQMLFCLKEFNQQKINSHRWFFQAFGPALEPNICVLIDAGTKPGHDSIYQLWRAFYLNPQCAGACGEIKAELTGGNVWKNPLVATQNFEYKMSNILDKPLESVFGFISVLPGAFSAYRYVALQNDATGSGPLEMYFKGEGMHAGTVQAGILEKNMYLAEDRILCFELVTKRKARWTLQYVKSAHAETDVPDNVAELVKQRRRWLNGSFFAAIFALVQIKSIWRSDHSALRKLAFLVEFFYQTVSLLFSWFALANFFLVFRILVASLGEPEMNFAPGAVLSVVFEWIYFGVLFVCFVLALGNKPDGSKKMYFSMMIFWAVIMVYLMFAAIYISVKSIKKELAEEDGFSAGDLFSNSIFRDLVISLASTYVLYFIASFMYLEPWHMFTSFIQYLLLSPSYINVLNIYAFCNVHDISWGTKGATGGHGSSAKDEVKGGLAADGSSLKQATKDRDENYEEELKNLAGLSAKKAKEKSESELKAEADLLDSYYYADVRCWVVLAWAATNFALAAIILNSGGLNRLVSGNPEEVQNTRSTIYMAVVLWSVAVLALVRFLGATWFLVLRMFRGV